MKRRGFFAAVAALLTGAFARCRPNYEPPRLRYVGNVYGHRLRLTDAGFVRDRIVISQNFEDTDPDRIFVRFLDDIRRRS